jgi:hypothetical protein
VPDVPSDEQLAVENAALWVENAALRGEVEQLRASDAAARAGHAGLTSMAAVLTGQLAELERIVREQADEIAELKRQAAADSANSSPSAVVGCAVGEEAVVAEAVGAQARQAARRVVVFAQSHR